MNQAVLTFLPALLLLAQVTARADDLAPTVTKLVRQLDASEKTRREDAEQQLLKLGPAVLPLLPSAEDGSAEVKLRLARVRTQLETLRGEQEVKASELTLSGTAIPLSEVIAAIEKQTGNKLVDFRRDFGQQPDKKTFDLTFDKTPFWSAFDQILDQGGLTIYSYAGVPGLALVNRSGNELPRHDRGIYTGAFRVEATEVSAKRDLRDATGQALKLDVEVGWEPRLAPIAITQAAESVTAIGDNNEKLGAAPNGEFEATVNPGDATASMPLTFSLPSRDMKKITSLKGSFSVMLPGQVETFRFEKLTSGAPIEQRKGAVKVILEQARKNNDIWEIRVRVVFDSPGKALESHRTWILHNEAALETPGKESINFAGLETTRQADNEVGVAYLFDVPDIADHTFIYKTPTVLMNAAVPYELHDVALP
ncbi:MAG TPA: hypothetical protein VGN12_02360 [Pirellulales bacterium]|jgi:hypothetical protein